MRKQDILNAIDDEGICSRLRTTVPIIREGFILKDRLQGGDGKNVIRAIREEVEDKGSFAVAQCPSSDVVYKLRSFSTQYQGTKKHELASGSWATESK